MKRMVAPVWVVALLCVLAGCAGSSERPLEELAGKDNFVVAVFNQAEIPFYGLHYEYYLAGKPVGGTIVMQLEQDEPIPIEKGERLVCDFPAKGFPEGADLSTFAVEFFVVLQNGEELPAGALLEINAAYGNSYRCILAEDAQGNLLVELEEEKEG